MQKYKSNITSTSGAAIRGVPVLVIAEDGNNAALFLDRAGTVPAPNPLTTGPDGVFYFYAVNGRYSLRTTVDGVTITDDDVVLMMDPEEITVAGPIAEAVAAAQAAATAAEFAVEASGIPELVAAVQNAVVDANNAVSQASTAASNAAISRSGADSARDAAVIAKNAAEAALDSFDDRYLGAKAVAPTTDNDGGALLTGALYWDTVLPGMRSWNGGAWVTLPAATKASVGLGNVDNTSDASKPVSTATQAALGGKEPTIAAGTATQYWRGDKTWRDFFTDVRAATLTGLSTATNAVVAATDTVLAAIGKLQAQVSAKFDKSGGAISGSVSVAGSILATSGALGYGPGAGGTVVQATSKSTAVTLNKPSGRITMHNAALAAGAFVLFTFTNATIAFGDEVSITMIGGTNYRVETIDIWDGACTLRVTNISASSLSDALAFNFKVFKGEWS